MQLYAALARHVAKRYGLPVGTRHATRSAKNVGIYNHPDQQAVSSVGSPNPSFTYNDVVISSAPSVTEDGDQCKSRQFRISFLLCDDHQ
jgi:hypothetical protein